MNQIQIQIIVKKGKSYYTRVAPGPVLPRDYYGVA